MVKISVKLTKPSTMTSMTDKFEYVDAEELSMDELSPQQLTERRSHLKKIMALSAVIDVLISVPALATALPSFMTGPIAEEIVEQLISGYLAKSQLNVELSASDRIAGLIPIPGVTPLTLKCWRLLRKLPKS